MLDGVRLKSFAKLSGGRGIHVLVPLNDPTVTFEQTRSFAKAAALALERDDPKGVTASVTPRLREGKVFIDWWQNDPARTTVCTYSVRARQQPTISAPVSWSVLEDVRSLRQVLAGQAAALPRKDLLLPLLTCCQRLP
jgi:bifunctional non-homologous end joining protein LigD